jgi:hypothetical protein
MRLLDLDQAIQSLAPHHPARSRRWFWWRYHVLPALTAAAGLALLVYGYVAAPPAEPMLPWLAFHGGLLVFLVSCFFAIRWRRSPPDR